MSQKNTIRDDILKLKFGQDFEAEVGSKLRLKFDRDFAVSILSQKFGQGLVAEVWSKF